MALHHSFTSSQANYYVPIVFAQKVLINLYAMAIYEEISNTDFEGDLKKPGDIVRITRDPKMTIQAYDSNVDITYGDGPAEDGHELVCDQGYYWAYRMKDIDKIRLRPDYQDRVAAAAAASLKVEMDRNCLAAWSALADADNMGSTAGALSGNIDMGVAGTPVSLTASNVMHWFHKCNQVLDEQNVPENKQRYLTVPSWLVALIKDSDIQRVDVTGDSTGVIRTGQIGTIDGTTIYKSNNLPWNATSSESTVMFGVKDALTFAMELSEADTGKMEKQFANYFRGLVVFGRDAVQPEMFGVSVIKEG